MRPNTSDRYPRRPVQRGATGRSSRNILLTAALVLLAATVAASATSSSSLGRVWGGAASSVEAAVKSLASAVGVRPDKLSSSPSPSPAAAGIAPQEGGPVAFPFLAADKSDYQPGEMVTFSGTGWLPGETVTIEVAEDPSTHEAVSLTAVADADGKFADAQYTAESHGVALACIAAAAGQTSGNSTRTRFTVSAGAAKSMALSEAKGGVVAAAAAAPSGSTLSENTNALSLAQSIMGSSATVTNAQLRGRAGTFTGGASSLGLNTGVFLDSLDNATSTYDAQLDALTPEAATSGVVLEFDIVPSGNSISFQYVFASTDYTPYDDVFGAFLNNSNFALVGGQRVSVNTMFGAGGGYRQTGVLTATASVTAGQTYHLKLGVTDARDNGVDTTVYIKAIINQPPTAVGNSYATAEDTPLNVTAPGVLGNDSDPQGSPLTASLVSGPSHAASFTLNANGSFSYTPVADYFGPDSFTYRANDGSLNSNAATVSITVNPVNDAPNISGVPLSQTIDELTLYTLDANATDVDGPAGPITFSASDAPAGASLNSSTGLFTWTPSEAQGPGVYTVIFKATDGAGASSSTSLQLNVNEVNAAPVVSCTGLTRPADGTGKAAVSAAEVGAGSSDPENDQFTLSLSPAGPYSVGTTIVTLTATDSGGASSTCSAAITVKDVTPPAISGVPANMTIEATGASGSAAAWAAPTALDNVDGAVGVACSPASGSAFPFGATAVTCSATDAAGNPSSASFTVTVKDTIAPAISNLPGSGQAFNWVKINPSGATPSPRVGHQMVYDSARNKVILFGGQTTQGALFGGQNLTGQLLNDIWEWDGATMTWAQITPAGGPVPPARSFFAMAYDPSRGKVVLYGGKVDAIYHSTSGDTWEWDPAARTWTGFPGADTIVYGGLRASQMAYDPNLHQVIMFGGQAYWGGHNGATHAWTGSTWVQKSGAGPFARIGHAMVTDSARSRVVLFGGYDYLVNYPAGAFDPDTWEWDGTGWHQIAAAGPGTRVGVAMAYDPARHVTVLFGGGNANDTWEWAGTSWSPRSLPDSPPVRNTTGLAFDGTTMLLFGGGQGSGPALGDTWVLRPVSSITAEATGPDGARVSWDSPTAADTVDGSVPVTCAPASGSIFPLGHTTVICTSTDSHGNTGQASFTVTVQDTTAPALALSAVTAPATSPAGASVSYTASANDIVDGVVPVNCSPASGGNFAIGQTTVQCSATDSRGNNATGSFSVTVTNPAPVASDLSVSTDEDTALVVALNASDANGDALNFAVVTQPSHGALSGTAPNLVYTPASNYNGPDSFAYKASDGTTDSNVATVSLKVKPVNDAPALAHVGARAVDEEAALSFTAVGHDARDNPAPNALTYSLTGAPDGASINPSTGAFNWTPTEQQGAGSYTFTVRVTDDGSPNLSAEETITVTVSEVNVAPVIAGVPAALAGQWGDAVAFKATASDRDVTQPGDKPNALTYSLTGAPDGATIDPATGAFAWTPASTQVGAHGFSVRVTDDGTPALHHELPVQVTVGKRATLLGYNGETSRKYWETAAVSATLLDAGTAQPLAGKAVALGVGSQSAPPVATGADGKAQAGLHLMQDVGAYAATAVFAGDDLYLPSDDSEPFAVERADQMIKWADPSGIIYGTPLSAAQLSASISVAGASPAGAVSYSPAAGTLLGAGGGQSLTVNVAGTKNYNPAAQTVHIDVAKATPAVNWDAPAAVTLGVALSGTQLNATAAHPADSGPLAGQSLTGAFTYTPAAGAVLPVGDNALSVTFTPADPANYTTATTSVVQRVSYGVCALYDQTKAHKAGSTIPVKLQLCDASGTNVSSPSVQVKATGVLMISTQAPTTLADSGNSNPDFNFRYEPDLGGPGGGYIFNLSTKGYPTGTFQLIYTVTGDQTPHSVQFSVR